jgi:hypothetical protein
MLALYLVLALVADYALVENVISPLGPKPRQEIVRSIGAGVA